MVRITTAVLMAMFLASAAAFGAVPANAENGPGDGQPLSPPGKSDNKKEYPYELLKDSNGAPLRDEKGNFLVFHKDQGCIIALSVGDFAKLSAGQATQALQRPKDDTVRTLEKPNAKPKIHIPDEEKDDWKVIDMESPTVISEVHRRHADPDISDYKNHLSLSQVVYIRNGAVEGHISIKNTGVHKISDMELTLVIPTADGNAERYRYRLTTENDIPFVTRPPLPNGRTVTFPVKEKAPGGAGASVNERIRTEITYLRFADE